jgi:hypothetical protein
MVMAMITIKTRFFRALSLLLVGVSIFGIPSFAKNPVGRPAEPATEHDWSMYDWSMSPPEELGPPGGKTVALAACPPGVKGNEPEYWILINGAEPAKVTGGTCAGDGHPGTLQFMSHGAHARGETISSASGGLQEALIAARYSPSNPPGSSQSGRVIVPPGE